MDNRFAVLDLGSNTFHLLIVEQSTTGFTEVYRERVYTKLGKGGNQKILPEPYNAGIACLQHFKQLLDTYNVTSYKSIGTAALRTTSNGIEFLAEAKEKTGIEIQLIDGQEEASYIASGVVQATDMHYGHQWIMDIGGGSVEFILLENGNPIWMDSYKIGLGILKAQFHNSEPISASELAALDDFLSNQLTSVIQKAKEYNAQTLIGASGSFEVAQHILKLKPWTPHSYRCHVIDFYSIKEQILSLNTTERVKIDGLPPERVDLIIVALKLIDFVIRKCNIEEIIISDFALKEGVIREHYNNI